MNITVYLGANYGTDPALQQAVRELGQWLGQSGHTLVYGGSDSGLMVVLARSAMAAGATTIINPEVIIVRIEPLYDSKMDSRAGSVRRFSR